MEEHVYKIVQLAGASETSIEDAVQKAISRADQTLEHLRWFRVTETRGKIEGGKVAGWQVVLEVGFTLQDK